MRGGLIEWNANAGISIIGPHGDALSYGGQRGYYGSKVAETVIEEYGNCGGTPCKANVPFNRALRIGTLIDISSHSYRGNNPGGSRPELFTTSLRCLHQP